MKKIYYYLMMMVAVFCLASCADDDDSPVLNSVTPGQLSLDAGSINGDNSKYTFTWTNAQFYVNGDLQRPVSLVGYEKSGVEYILMGVETGREWTEAVTFGSVVSENHLTLDYEAIAKIMQDNFGMVRSLDEEFNSSIDFKLMASYASPDDAVVESNTITVPFTLTVQPPFEGEKANLFISLDTDWSDDVYVYAWADGVADTDLFGGWGGYKIEGETVIGPDGNPYYEIPLNDNFYKATVHLIIHDDVNDGEHRVETQSVLAVTFADEDEDVYLRVVGNEIDGYDVGRVEKSLPKLYVHSNLPWQEYAMYVWPEDDELPGWPGIQPSRSEVINGETWLVFEVTKPYTKKATNWIINNNGAGSQYDLMQGYSFTKNTFVRVAADGAFSVSGGPIESDGYVVYADDQTGWDAIALYQWGDVNDFGGAWPGKQPDGTVAIDGVTWTYFNYGADVKGLNQNLIFNNNGGGVQIDGPTYTFDSDLYVTVTSSEVTVK